MGRKKDKLVEDKIQELSFKNLKDRLEVVIDRLHQLLKRVTEKTDLAVFLTKVSKDFQFDMRDNWQDMKVITLDDKLDALKF